MTKRKTPITKKAGKFFQYTAQRFEIKRRLSRRTMAFYAFGIFFLLVVGFYTYRILFLRDFALQSKQQIYSQLEEARTALRNLDPDGARAPLGAVDQEIQLVSSEVDKYGVLTITKLWGLVVDKVQAIPSLLQQLAGISGTAIHINEDIAFINENAAALMIGHNGQELLDRLDGFRGKLKRLVVFVDNLSNQRANVDPATQSSLASLRAEIMRTTDAVEAITNLIGSPQPKHLAVLFINPSEIRPGGGFIGSYADIELQLGSINSIEISDIYDPDGQLDQHVIPPEPLQQITKDWEARDANWFFDYPTSAKKIIGFLNNSKIYQEKEVIFDAAISINTNVLEDLMTLIGPVELKEYKLTITPENFLSELQREVESGADKKVNQPKKILKVLAPIILEQLTTLDSAEKQSLARMLRKHSTDRDIMLYFNDKTLQRYVQSQGIGGEILAPRNGAVNEYLAVVNANIGGAKSDAFIKQGIDFKASINELGEISNVLTVTREHTGKKEKDWWYRATNRNYLQIYTPAGSRLQRSTGRSIWPRDPKYNYKNYSTDPDISTIADTQRYRDEFGIDRMIISGKTVFAAWFNTTAGAKSTFVLEYKNPYRLSPDSEIPYEFVFEKQSGANTTLSISIAAPPKYRWKEINKSVIEYKTDDPPGRIRIRQTLIPIE